jgi:hypothetical protein
MGKPVNGEKRDISIKRTIISVFLAAMLVSLLGIGYLIFANWYASAEKTGTLLPTISAMSSTTALMIFCSCRGRLTRAT